MESSTLNLFVETKIGLLTRLKIIYKILFQSKWNPVIKFSNGVEFDLNNNKIILNNPTHIHCKNTFEISTDKHLILNSGRTKEIGRPGYYHSIWENSDKDENGNPIMMHPFLDKNDNKVFLPVKFDDNEKIIVPDGYIIVHDGCCGEN